MAAYEHLIFHRRGRVSRPTGDSLRIEYEGKVVEARACIVGNKIYVRADHPHFTATQLTKHELTHDKIDSGEIVTKNVYDMMVAYYGEAKVKDIIKAYAEAYDMGYDTQEAADAVFVEIVCDSEAGINYFAMEEQVGTPHFMENVHYGTQADMNSRDTRGPPVDGETHFSRETERFLRNFTGEVRYDEYLYLSDVEVATIRSNIKSRATYLSKTAVDGLVWAHSLNRGYAYTFLCNPDYSVTVTDVLDAESDIAIINRTTERMINYARTGASVRRNSSLNGQQRNGNQPSNNSGGTHAQTSQSQGTKGLVGQPSQSNRQGSVGTGAQNRTNSGADKTRNTQKVKFSREAADKAYLDAVESGDMETAQRFVNEAANRAGRAIRAYHGTARADRVGTVFRPDRATSGPMAYFTDNREIAENYAKSKKDTSLAYDEEYTDYYSQFRVNQNGKSIKVQDLWRSLPFAEKQRLKEAGKHITWDEDMENIVWDDDATHGLGNWDAYTLNQHKGNAIEALIDCWLESGELFGNEGDFLQVLEMAGIKGVEYRDPDARYEKVYDTFLFIQNPFNTATVDENFVSGFEKWYSQQPEGKYDRGNSVADMWDKNNQTIEMFLTRLRDDIKNRTTYAWTSIPDSMTDYLKYLEYDGIRDTGGKFGGDGHSVWIPFYSEQVKSAEPVVYDDSGKIIPLSERFNLEKKDIRFSREQKQEVNPYGQDGKAEDHASFIRRMHEGSRRVKQIGNITYAFHALRVLEASNAATEARRELRRLGIKCFLHNGLEYNQNGYTYQDTGVAATLADGSVGLYGKSYGDGTEYAGHEAFHVWKHSTERDAYVETLRRNIDITSSVYGIEQADTVLRKYFDGNVEALAKKEAKAQFQEELYALVSGKIHSGANEAGLKTMFKDYAAVKAAWDDLIKKQAKDALYSSQETDLDSNAHPYAYNTLISKPDMVVTTVNGNVPKNRADVVYQAKQNAAKVGKFDPQTGSASVYVDDVGADVVLGTPGLKHGLEPRRTENAVVTLKAGEILKHSIRINELTPKKETVDGSYVLVGAAKGDDGSFYVVRSVVNRVSHKLISMDVLYAINAKKENRLRSMRPGFQSPVTDSTISIADLLDLVNQYFPDILPEDVLKHYGYDARPEGDLGKDALYSGHETDADVFNPEGKTLDEQLDDILKSAESFDGRYLYIGRITPTFINMLKEYIDIKDLPVVMNYRDAYLSMESKENGRYQGDGINYHNLGKEGMKRAIEAIGRPEQVMLSKKSGKIELVLECVDYKGDKFLSIIALNASARNAKKFIEAHIVTSIYGRRSMDKYVAKAEREGRLIYNKKEETVQGISQVQYEGNINTDSSKTNISRESKEVKSEHETDYSNRSLLANAFEGITKSSVEYKLIQEYKGRIKILNEYEEKLSKLNAEIRKLTFGTEGKRDTQKLKQLQAKAKEVAENINRNDKKLLSLEASEPLRKVIERERKKEAQKTKDHVKEIQRSKKVRAEQTELRHKIRKTFVVPTSRLCTAWAKDSANRNYSTKIRENIKLPLDKPLCLLL